MGNTNIKINDPIFNPSSTTVDVGVELPVILLGSGPGPQPGPGMPPPKPIPGPQGLQGIMGAQGLQGPMGLHGHMGPVGATGARGPVGAGFEVKGSVSFPQDLRQAPLGTIYAVGGEYAYMQVGYEKGDEGTWNKSWKNIGRLSTQGLQGAMGPAGAQGLQGTMGIQGPMGLQGYYGLQGIAGAQGQQGFAGLQGATGVQGTQGSRGEGVTGLQGAQGPAGLGMTGAVGPKGDPGMSAYEVAKYLGFSGTAEEWIQSIQGARGLQGVTGVQGLIGPQGTIGQSAYQLAQSLGFTGSLRDWLNSLVGATGIQGAVGLQGATGAIGATGPQGPKGEPFKIKIKYRSISEMESHFGDSSIELYDICIIDSGVPGETDNGKLYYKGLIQWEFITDLSDVNVIVPTGSTVSGVQGPRGYQGVTGLQGVQGIAGSSNVDVATSSKAGLVKPSDDFIVNSDGTLSINKEHLNLNTDKVIVPTDIKATTDIGGIQSTDVITKDSTLESVLQKLLTKRVEPTYTAPSLNLRLSNYKEKYEAGTKINLTVTSEFTQNDGGAVTSDLIKYNDEVINPNGELQVESEFTVKDENNTFSNYVRYSDGPVKNDSIGDPSPEGQIKAGELVQTKNIFGARYAYARSSDSDVEVTSDNVRNSTLFETSYLDPQPDVEYKVKVSEGDRYIVIVVPSSVGELSQIIQSSLGLNVISSFEKSTIQVEGANGYSKVDYNIYKYESMIGLSSDTFKFVI